jgi:hypothetical protein
MTTLLRYALSSSRLSCTDCTRRNAQSKGKCRQ